MESAKGETIELWCYLAETLPAVFDKFNQLFPSDDDFYDCENVWEWFDGRTIDGSIGFNISRAHGDMEANPDEPIRFSLFLNSPGHTLDSIATQLAKALSTQIFTGHVEYNSSNDGFQFNVLKTFG